MIQIQYDKSKEAMDDVIVDLLDSDDEQQPEPAQNDDQTPMDTDPISTPIEPTEPLVKPIQATSSPVRNRPGPLSAKLKMGIQVDKDDIIASTSNSNNKLLEQQQNGGSNDGKNKILTKLIDPNSKFLADFDPERSDRERRKMARKGPTSTYKPGTLYDDHGIHRETELDVCDCLDLTCPGCHFPCQNCRSNKWYVISS